MATVACPECGLPRAEAALGTPCPVCAAAPIAAPARPPKPAAPDPTDGLPADASELDRIRPEARRKSVPRALVVGAAVFVAGALAGAGGVLGWQALDPAKPEETEVAAKPAAAPASPTAPRGAAVAPMPHESRAQPAEPDAADPDPEPDPKLLQPPPPPGRVITIEVNEPGKVYSLPFPMKKGAHVVLKGKVKTLKVSGLDAGSILDASALEAATVSVTGKIDGGSTLKVSAPNGLVNVGAKIEGKSAVEVSAPGGEVKFGTYSTAKKNDAVVGAGARVTVTARVVEFKGDIGGAGTAVSVVLTRNAWLKVGSVSGTATVEYRSQAGGWAAPDVAVGPVAPTATFRKAGE